MLKAIDLPEGSSVKFKEYRDAENILYVRMDFNQDTEKVPDKLKIRFNFDNIDCYSTWSPKSGLRSLNPNWSKSVINSRLASWMPIQSLVSISGKNRLCIAVSDAFTPIRIGTGICEETAAFECDIIFFTELTSPLSSYSATIRIDTRDIPFYDAIYDVSKWWETECGYTPSPVPDSARMPMNSLWYSFHQQLDADEIVRQCILSKPLGMDTVIIDDGWQTDDNSRGYAFCGDWEPTESKVGDMRALTDVIHQTGTKVMLWFSVPYIGIHSKAYEKFKDMTLDNGHNGWFCLDPRYKATRDYLINIYTKAVRDWNLDGLKLDFIDAFKLTDKSLIPDKRRDFTSLDQAVDKLMTDTMAELKKINPDIMIEFRQTYIGPAIRKYGNMLRVADCPNDAVKNRIAIADMRFTSGATPVHSDMIMWNPNDTVESAALQFANIVFSVPQISVRPDKLSEEHKKMLTYYISFWRSYRDVLIDGKLTATAPECGYTVVRSKLGPREVIAVYDKAVIDNVAPTAVIVNASGYNHIYVDGCGKRHYKTVDCTGVVIDKGDLTGDISRIAAPVGSMVFIGNCD